jgi:hypothetical protein
MVILKATSILGERKEDMSIPYSIIEQYMHNIKTKTEGESM